MHTSWWIRGGRIVDPVSRRDGIGDLVIENGVVCAGDTPARAGVPVIDARGRTLVPGLIDLHVHFREPGDPEAETVATGCAAAARGGFTTVVTMPNTRPPTDTPAAIRETLERGQQAGQVRIRPAACITAGRAGHDVAQLAALAEAGAAAFTDDGATVADSAVLERAMLQAARLGRPILDHALDPVLAGHGVMHEGPASTRLGLPGIPAQAEIDAVRRDIRLAETTGCRMHIQHVSCAETVHLIAEARRKGLFVSGEATPHHIALTDEDVVLSNANFKMNPPLGSAADRDAIRDGLCDGTISVLATDHAPHTAAAKARGFRAAPFGIVGLETALAVTYTLLVASGRMTLSDWLARWTRGPAEVLGLAPPCLAPGQPADLTLLDLESEWTVDSCQFHSKSRNTPFEGRRVKGSAVCTFCAGRMSWHA